MRERTTGPPRRIAPLERRVTRESDRPELNFLNLPPFDRSCQRHGKDPLAYLRDVLARLPSLTNQDDLTPLTPAGWQPP
jgi:hypothetical protein